MSWFTRFLGVQVHEGNKVDYKGQITCWKDERGKLWELQSERDASNRRIRLERAKRLAKDLLVSPAMIVRRIEDQRDEYGFNTKDGIYEIQRHEKRLNGDYSAESFMDMLVENYEHFWPQMDYIMKNKGNNDL